MWLKSFSCRKALSFFVWSYLTNIFRFGLHFYKRLTKKIDAPPTKKNPGVVYTKFVTTILGSFLRYYRHLNDQTLTRHFWWGIPIQIMILRSCVNAEKVFWTSITGAQCRVVPTCSQFTRTTWSMIRNSRKPLSAWRNKFELIPPDWEFTIPKFDICDFYSSFVLKV